MQAIRIKQSELKNLDINSSILFSTKFSIKLWIIIAEFYSILSSMTQIECKKT